jgi:multiple antibiotic resistance protein
MDLVETLHWAEYSKLLIGLLAIVNIPSSIFLFMPLTSEFNEKQKREVALTAAIATALTLVVFTFFGTLVLDLFGISIESFRVAGGLLILLSALKMIGGAGTQAEKQPAPGAHTSVAITPLAIPSLAGPGAISTIIVYAHLSEEPSFGHEFVVTVVILTVAAIVFIGLRLAPAIEKKLGQTGVDIFNRVMGLVVAAIAIEFIAAGILGFFPNLA